MSASVNANEKQLYNKLIGMTNKSTGDHNECLYIKQLFCPILLDK